MSRRRYLSTDISVDPVVNRLAIRYGDFAALLYTWMIPHAEDDAVLTGDPEELLFKVMPGRRDKSESDVEAALEGMEGEGLILWDRDNELIQFPLRSFYHYQTYISKEKRRTANITEEQRTSPKNSDNRRTSAENTVSLSPSPSLIEDNVHSSKRQPKNPTGYTPEFESFWSEYPLRKSKVAAFRCWKVRINEGEWTPDELITTAKRYSKECRRKGTPDQFIKHASTFLGKDKHFEDYLDGAPVEEGPLDYIPTV